VLERISRHNSRRWLPGSYFRKPLDAGARGCIVNFNSIESFEPQVPLTGRLPCRIEQVAMPCHGIDNRPCLICQCQVRKQFPKTNSGEVLTQQFALPGWQPLFVITSRRPDFLALD
jgi:hypothetical protein